MIILIIIQATKFARFMKDVWRETQRLRRSFPGPSEE
jgi:hypothetical protein